MLDSSSRLQRFLLLHCKRLQGALLCVYVWSIGLAVKFLFSSQGGRGREGGLANLCQRSSLQASQGVLSVWWRVCTCNMSQVSFSCWNSWQTAAALAWLPEPVGKFLDWCPSPMLNMWWLELWNAFSEAGSFVPISQFFWTHLTL